MVQAAHVRVRQQLCCARDGYTVQLKDLLCARVCVRVRARVCARARARVRVCVRARARLLSGRALLRRLSDSLNRWRM
jgi:hypothetical protein